MEDTKNRPNNRPNNRPISDLIDREYREYSMYVIESRAIPSLVDGLKPVQRKTLYAAIKQAQKKRVKVSEIAGLLSGLGYHHGDASAQAACVSMAQEWNNNYPLLRGHGDFGSRLIQEASAPRYIHVSLSNNFEQYFTDPEILPAREDDPESPEPLHYLPVVPWVLVNGVVGIAVGFATTILPRDVATIAEATRKIMGGKAITPDDTKPTFPHFEGTVKHDEGLRWIAEGIVDNPKDVTYVVRELPPGWDREKYVSFLNKLEDSGHIKDYSDLCANQKFHFEIKVTREQKKKVEKDRLGFFKARKSFTENLTVIDHNGKLKVYSSIESLIRDFIDYRLEMYGKKIEKAISDAESEIAFLQAKMKFINFVIDENVVHTMTKEELRSWVERKTGISDKDTANSIISIPIFSCTKDKIEELESQQQRSAENLNWWKSQTEREYYASVLENI